MNVYSIMNHNYFKLHQRVALWFGLFFIYLFILQKIMLLWKTKLCLWAQCIQIDRCNAHLVGRKCAISQSAVAEANLMNSFITHTIRRGPARQIYRFYQWTQRRKGRTLSMAKATALSGLLHSQSRALWIKMSTPDGVPTMMTDHEVRHLPWKKELT